MQPPSRGARPPDSSADPAESWVRFAKLLCLFPRESARVREAASAFRASLEAVRSGLREVVRRIAQSDGLPLSGWTDERVDRMLRRLAAWSPGPCPSPLVVAEGCHQEHVVRCPRCERLTRLLAAAGRMALSNYLAQSVVFSLVFYGFGFGLFGRLGSAVAALLGLAVFAGQLVISEWWFRRFRFGPAEWFWRRYF